MRKKSEARRQAILEVAARTFRELGFERASMSEICARVGGSKATLYNYFPSKEDLFFEVMFDSAEAEFEATQASLDPAADDIAANLQAYGVRLLRQIYSPQILAARRLVIAESGRSNLGRLCYEKGLKPCRELTAEFLRAAMTNGKLREADANVADAHLHGLLESELLDRYMLCVHDTVTDAEIAACTERAIGVFMAAYGC
jgi:AcrR family transcriptional regulator